MEIIEVEMKTLDILVIGPARSGKTTMLRTYDLLHKIPEQ